MSAGWRRSKRECKSSRVCATPHRGLCEQLDQPGGVALAQRRHDVIASGDPNGAAGSWRAGKAAWNLAAPARHRCCRAMHRICRAGAGPSLEQARPAPRRPPGPRQLQPSLPPAARAPSAQRACRVECTSVTCALLLQEPPSVKKAQSGSACLKQILSAGVEEASSTCLPGGKLSKAFPGGSDSFRIHFKLAMRAGEAAVGSKRAASLTREDCAYDTAEKEWRVDDEEERPQQRAWPQRRGAQQPSAAPR